MRGIQSALVCASVVVCVASCARAAGDATFNGMAHGWAGGPTSNGCPTFARATELEWNFFKQ